MPAQTQYSAPAWGQSPYEDFEVPSGGTVQLKNLDFEDIIKAGLVDEMDQISPTVEQKVVGPKNGKPLPGGKTSRQAKKPTKAEQAKAAEQANKEFFAQGGQFSTIVRVMAKLLPVVVVQPELTSHLDENDEVIPLAEREEGRIYADSVPLPDRMAIFGHIMKGMDMEGLKQFREQSEQDLGDVENGEGDGVQTE